MADVTNSKIFETIEGIPNLKDVLVVLVKTEWNAAVVDELERGALSVLKQHGLQTRTLVVPGAIEIPFAIRKAMEQDPGIAAFIALGCVIRGGTPHFDYVCQSVTNGITQLNLTLPAPVIFGVLTVDNDLQAQERIGGVHGHKGEEAGITAIKMIALNHQLKEERK